jgi:hypothetical protein
MMTAAPVMTAAAAMTEMFTMMTAAVAMTEMFTMMTAAVAMTEMFTMMAAVTDQKPAGKAVVRIGASVVVRVGASVVVRVGASVVVRVGASVVVRVGASVVVRIGASVVRIVGVVTVISAPARKQRGHQQSRQNPSPGNLSPPDRFQLGKTSYLFKLGAGSKVVYLHVTFGVVFGSAPFLLQKWNAHFGGVAQYRPIGDPCLGHHYLRPYEASRRSPQFVTHFSHLR